MTTYVGLSTPGVLLPAPARSFERVRRTLGKVGIATGTRIAAHATRTYNEQVAIFLVNYTTDASADLYHPIDARKWNGKTYYRRAGKAAAARPGTSNHGRGDTVDWQGLGDYGSESWKKASKVLIENGWNNDEGRLVDEPWHWTYVEANDKYAGGDMSKPNFHKTIRQKDFPIPEGTFTTLPINDDGDTSILIDDYGRFISTATLVLSGLEPGDQIQMRYYKVSYKSGTPTQRFYAYEIVEAIGTDASSFPQVVQLGDLEVKSGRSTRLRFEVAVFTKRGKGAKLRNLVTRTDFWRD